MVEIGPANGGFAFECKDLRSVCLQDESPQVKMHFELKVLRLS